MATMEKDRNLANVFKFGLEIFKKSQKLNMDSFYRENRFNISFWFRRDAVAFESNTTEVSFLNQLWPKKAKLPRQCLLTTSIGKLIDQHSFITDKCGRLYKVKHLRLSS